jgi:hypothetical protein
MSSTSNKKILLSGGGIFFIVAVIIGIIIFISVRRTSSPSIVTGRYVKLFKPSTGCLNIADISVFSKGTNVAKGKVVTLSSPFLDNAYPGSLLVDEILDNFAHTACNSAAHMTIDLGSEYEIDTIKVHNRKDCCQGRILGSTLEILDSSNKLLWSSEPFKNKNGKITPDEGSGDAYMVYEAHPPSPILSTS